MVSQFSTREDTLLAGTYLEGEVTNMSCFSSEKTLTYRHLLGGRRGNGLISIERIDFLGYESFMGL